MAQTTPQAAPVRPDRRTRNDLDLRTIRLDVEEIPELAEEWDELADNERTSWFYVWDNAMGGVANLLAERRRGQLTAAQERALDALLARLHEWQDQILGLWIPELTGVPKTRVSRGDDGRLRVEDPLRERKADRR